MIRSIKAEDLPIIKGWWNEYSANNESVVFGDLFLLENGCVIEDDGIQAALWYYKAGPFGMMNMFTMNPKQKKRDEIFRELVQNVMERLKSDGVKMVLVVTNNASLAKRHCDLGFSVIGSDHLVLVKGVV